MKLIVQIPCYNEEETLPLVLADLPRDIEGIDVVEVLIIDDGSTDQTVEVAKRLGVDHVVSNPHNMGLARTFQRGLEECLERGADIIVNIDGDNQYRAQDIPKVVAPVLRGEADMVIANRQTHLVPHFGPVKKLLQRLGSSVVRFLSGVDVTDAVSGFRAFNRNAASKLTILSEYTYTIESILQARAKGLVVGEVDSVTNPKLRESRLMRSIQSYIAKSVGTMVRVFTMYNPLKVFLMVGGGFFGVGFLLGVRFVYYFVTRSGGSGHVQSLILAAVLMIVGVLMAMSGLIADLIRFNRILIEDVRERTKRLERVLGASAPSLERSIAASAKDPLKESIEAVSDSVPAES